MTTFVVVELQDFAGNACKNFIRHISLRGVGRVVVFLNVLTRLARKVWRTSKTCKPGFLVARAFQVFRQDRRQVQAARCENDRVHALERNEAFVCNFDGLVFYESCLAQVRHD